MPHLLQRGHTVYALVRKKEQFPSNVHVIEADLLDRDSLNRIPEEIDAAYYLVHSMKESSSAFIEMEAESAQNFQERLSMTKAQQIIYLSGLVNEENLSKHLMSRKNVDRILRKGTIPVTTLMAGIIIGAKSASFQIIRDLVYKLPIMVAPRWIENLTQPIAVSDVLDYLILVLGDPRAFQKHFEIGGPDVFTYKELLLEFARLSGLKRKIFTVPVLTPRLSSYWLYFVTSASFPLAQSLVDSLKNNAVCKEGKIKELYPKKLLTFEEAIKVSTRF